MGPDWHIESWFHLTQPLPKRQTLVSGEAPAQAALPSMTGNLATNARGHNQALQCNSACLATKRLIEQFQDRDESRCVEQRLEILQTEEERDTEEPRCNKTNGHGAHDGNWDHLFRTCNLLGHMCRAVKAGKSPISIDEANNKGDTILRPPCVVDKVGEDKLGLLMCWGLCWNRDEDDEEGNQRSVQCYSCNPW